MEKTKNTMNLLKPLQNELNKALRNPIYAFALAENMMRDKEEAIGCLPPGMLIQPIKHPSMYDLLKQVTTYSGQDADQYKLWADPLAPTSWYLCDEKDIKFNPIMEETMNDESKTFKYAVGYANPVPNDEEPKQELNIQVEIEIKDGHILAEFGCVKHICHNLNELVAFAKKELLKEMPILKDFGKVGPLTKKAEKKAVEKTSK